MKVITNGSQFPKKHSCIKLTKLRDMSTNLGGRQKAIYIFTVRCHLQKFYQVQKTVAPTVPCLPLLSSILCNVWVFMGIVAIFKWLVKLNYNEDTLYFNLLAPMPSGALGGLWYLEAGWGLRPCDCWDWLSHDLKTSNYSLLSVRHL